MKHLIFKLFLLAGTTFTMFSCTTSQTMTIEGQPGTEILTPGLKNLGTIGNNRKVNIKIPSDDYYAFLLARSNGSKELVPFALDYRNKKYSGTKTQHAVGIGLAVAGLTGLIPGFAMIAADSESEVGGYIIAGSFGTAGIGCAIGMPAYFRLQQTQYQYQYKYLSHQSTNEDFTFTRPVDNGFVRTVGHELQHHETHVENSEGIAAATSAAIRRRGKTSAATRNLRDYGQQVSGTFIGTGKLLLAGEEVESYADIKVVIKRVDKNNVLVEVYESGEPFFNAADKYSVKQNGKKKYMLSLKGIPSATISISNQKNMVYLHPKVNIDGEIYTLSITASMQE
ncbi:MAG: hypothetical protein IJZ92_07120 [Bacteroidaceae bacterium]|nr:hypothetical protein [Bacteroidaceae bacterium]